MTGIVSRFEKVV